MISKTASNKKPRRIKESAFFLDFVRFTGCIPGWLWTRPKAYYAGDKKKSLVRKGVLIAANHVTFIDPIVLYCVFWRRRLHFLVTKDLYKNKVFSWMLTMVGCIQVDKENFSMASMHETVDRLKAGKAVLIFPEGQVNGQGDTLSYKSGAVLMSKLSGVPIQPVYIARPPKKFSRYRVVIGEPIDIPSMCSRFPSVEELQKVSDYVRSQEQALEEYYQTVILKK